MNTDDYLKYTDNWVAIEENTNEILAASKELKSLKKDIVERKLTNIVIHYLTSPSLSLSPYATN